MKQQTKQRDRRVFWLFAGALLLFFAASVFFVRRGDFPNHYAFGYEMTHTDYGSFGSWLVGVFRVRAYPAWGLMVGYLGRFLAWLLGALAGRGADAALVGAYTVQQAADTLACALVNAALLWLTVYMTWRLFLRFAREAAAAPNGRFRLAVLALSVSFFGALYVPGVFQSFPVGAIRVSVWQNPTQPAVEACALACFFLFADMIENRQARAVQKRRVCGVTASVLTWEYCLLAVLLLLSAVQKPSFYQAFIPAMFVYCCMDLAVSRGKSFWFDFRFGFVVLPVCALLAAQYTLLFTEGDYGGVGVGLFHVWRMSVRWPLVALVLSCAFPLVLCGMLWRQLARDKTLLVALLTFGSGLLQWSLLYTMDHPNWGDFSWGVNLGNRILITVCLLRLLNAKSQKNLGTRARKIAWALFWMQVAAGLLYFFYFWGVAVGELAALLF